MSARCGFQRNVLLPREILFLEKNKTNKKNRSAVQCRAFNCAFSAMFGAHALPPDPTGPPCRIQLSSRGRDLVYAATSLLNYCHSEPTHPQNSDARLYVLQCDPAFYWLRNSWSQVIILCHLAHRQDNNKVFCLQ